MRRTGLILLISILMSVSIMAQKKDLYQKKQMKQIEVATLGNGCFWCTEAIFQRLEGVKKVNSGYSGGTVKKPSYKDVSSGYSGHAEVIQLKFDSSKISYRELLEVFFSTHDPTTLNRQGYDVGSQYRSAIFYHNEEQQQVADRLIKELTAAKVFNKKIVTEVTEFDIFFKAEVYHQNYYNLNKNQGYCRAVINPKLDKFRKEYRDKLKK